MYTPYIDWLMRDDSHQGGAGRLRRRAPAHGRPAMGETERSSPENVLLVDVTKTREGAFAVDEERRIVSWNRAAEELLGYPAAEPLGSPSSHPIQTPARAP